MNHINLIWIILLPLIGFLINGLGRNFLSKTIIAFLGSAVILASFVLSFLLFKQMLGTNEPINQHVFTVLNTENLIVNFSLRADQLSILFMLVITGVGFLIHLYSSAYMHEETASHYARYFAYLNLFIFSMLLLVMGNNLIIMFVGWEGVGMCSYLLIGYWFKNIDFTKAAKKAFVMNRIGDLGVLLAIFWLLAKLGSVDYDVITNASLISDALASNKINLTDITGITLLLFIGATGKSAQLPLFTWLPDAMAGPTPVSALIHAATMVTAGIYLIARCNYLFTLAPTTMLIIAIIGIATALVAATIALKQNDIKKVLAYSTVSQLGYMFLGLGVGAFTGSVFHVITHAFFKALLFLGAGSVIHAMHHEQDIRNMGGLSKKIPITHLTFLIGCIAIGGIPPFSGFFSKDEILAGAFASNPIFWLLGFIGALFTAFYMFRLYTLTFKGTFRGTEHQYNHLHESPWQMTLPLIILAVLSIIAGFMGIPEVLKEKAHLLSNWLTPVFESSTKIQHHQHPSHNTEMILIAVSVIGAIIAAIFAFISNKNGVVNESKGLGKVLENKWFVDEAYNAAIVQPINKTSNFLTNIVEKSGIDGVVNGVGKFVNYSSLQLRKLQNGFIGEYVLIMIFGIVLLFIIKLFVK